MTSELHYIAYDGNLFANDLIFVSTDIPVLIKAYNRN